MKSGKLLVFGILGLAVLGYVIVELTASDRRDKSPEDAERTATAAAEGPNRDKPRRKVMKGSTPDGPVKKANRVVPVNVEPPPPPPPPMPKDEARQQFDDYINELQAVKDEGRALENEEWTDFYKRGNEALDPLSRSLDSSLPAEADEVNRAHERFRTLIMELEPKPPGAAPRPSDPQ